MYDLGAGIVFFWLCVYSLFGVVKDRTCDRTFSEEGFTKLVLFKAGMSLPQTD